jgi:predicted Zn-dependent peptidase
MRDASLSNGLRLCTTPGPGFPKDEVSLALTIPVRDSRAEKQSGLAHLTEHLIVRCLKRAMASNGPIKVYGETHFDGIMIRVDALRSHLPAVISTMLSLFWAAHIIVTDDAVREEICAVRAELEAIEASPKQRVLRLGYEIAYGDQPEGVGDPAGHLESILRVSRKDLTRYCGWHLQPQKCFFIVVGGFANQDEITDLILSNWPVEENSPIV